MAPEGCQCFLECPLDWEHQRALCVGIVIPRLTIWCLYVTWNRAVLCTLRHGVPRRVAIRSVR